MEENFNQKITLHELAGIACMSVPNFIIVFKDTYYTTPMDYLIRLRVQKACEMLQDREKNTLRWHSNQTFSTGTTSPAPAAN